MEYQRRRTLLGRSSKAWNISCMVHRRRRQYHAHISAPSARQPYSVSQPHAQKLSFYSSYQDYLTFGFMCSFGHCCATELAQYGTWRRPWSLVEKYVALSWRSLVSNLAPLYRLILPRLGSDKSIVRSTTKNPILLSSRHMQITSE